MGPGELQRQSEQLQALAHVDFEAAHGFAPKKPPAEPEGGEENCAAVFKIIVNCPTEAFHKELGDAPEKNCAGDAAALAVLARPLKGMPFTPPNVTRVRRDRGVLCRQISDSSTHVIQAANRGQLQFPSCCL